MDLSVALTAFLLIVPVELPDKTFIATLVLASRYRPLAAWIGVGLAFAVQSLVAVSFGGLLTRLPTRPVTAAAAVLFLIGAIVLWRGAGASDAEGETTEQEFAGRTRTGLHGLRAVGASFLVLFLAEWGDLSQLLTAGLVVRYGEPVSVFVGAWVALLLVSGVAALVGRALLKRLRLSAVRRIGAAVCAVLGVLTLLSAFGVTGGWVL